MKKILLLTIVLSAWLSSAAENINRRAVITRNNPYVSTIDTLSSFTVGNGGFAYTTDITGLQTFTDIYKNGIPLCTISDWGWHSFANTENYKPEEALTNLDFGRGPKAYSIEQKEPRRKAAANFLRANPHRLNLGVLGFDFHNINEIRGIKQELDMWTGIIDSHFLHNGKAYHVETLCHPTKDIIGTKIIADENIRMSLRFPYPSGNHTDDGCLWNGYKGINKTEIIKSESNHALLKHTVDTVSYYVAMSWKGNVKLTQNDANSICITSGNSLDISCEFISNSDISKFSNKSAPCFDIIKRLAIAHWRKYWTEGGIVDFSQVKDKRAKELERRTIQSLYLLAVNDAGDYPPAETGLTYNSWFGKFHLEMIYWHQAYQALWGHPEQLEHTLDWYLKAEPIARSIAQRQGFKGVRWMKMTDPSGKEAPSKVGSLLIWQQPHLIYLAELLYRAGKKDVLKKYAKLVEETAEFMADYAEYDNAHNRYILRGCIPAQETLRPDSTLNPPFELSYWHTTLGMAQKWRERRGMQRNKKWDDIINNLAKLADKDGIYLSSELAPLPTNIPQTDTPTGDAKYASDHPMMLGALGMMPYSDIINMEKMQSTFDWVWKNWNWQKTWGWDYPMTAMCAVRLGNGEKAVDALLKMVQKNTYLNNGHNYQNSRLRVYLPGNGGLLTTIALMCAGWDGNTKTNVGFPKDWNVKWEGLLPLP
jgi:hypothetical protein